MQVAEDSPNGTGYNAEGFNQALSDAFSAVIYDYNNNYTGGGEEEEEEMPCASLMTFGYFMQAMDDFVDDVDELRGSVLALQAELGLSDAEASLLLGDEKKISVIEQYLNLTGGTSDDVILIKGFIRIEGGCQVGVTESSKKSLLDCTEQEKINRFKFAVSMQNLYYNTSGCGYNVIKWDRIFKDYLCDNYTDNCSTYDGLTGIVKSKQNDGTYIDIPVQLSFSGGPELAPGLNEQYLGNNKYKYGFRRPDSNNYELLAFYADEEYANMLANILRGGD